MAKNPMQRKARNSFILGMFITLIITGSIIGLLVFKLININKENKEKEQGLKNAYVLVTDIKSGDSIKLENLKKVDIETNIIPSNAITLSQIEENTIAKIDLKTGTILSSDMITNSDDKTTNDTRVQEYNMILLPSQINTNEYVDIRLRLPSGLDYIVVSKKKIEIPQVLGVASESTFSVKLNESETQTMSSAIVESYIMEGSILYVAKYVEPGIQGSSVPTYVPSTAVQEAIRQNSNITVEARNALVTRFNESITTRNSINSVLNTYNEVMKKISFIGAYDKTDLIIYIARILVGMKKKVLVIDATINQKAKYVVPVINPSKTYVTEFEGIDVAVGFNKITEIKNYIGITEEENLNYDYVLYDIDSSESFNNYNIEDSIEKYFVTSFDLYSLKKGIEILASTNKELKLTKVYFAREVHKEDDEYLNFLAKDYNIEWNEEKIYFPFEMGDQTTIAENQRVSKIKLKKLTQSYKEGLMYIIEQIMEDNEIGNLRKVFRQLERGV